MTERDMFIAALGIDDPVGRCAYLDQACGDDNELRKRLEVLLAAHEQCGTVEPPFQRDSAMSEPTADNDPTGAIHQSALVEVPGTIIGPYKLLQKIGEGGMGAVFMAEQEKPVRRKVALKVIKAGIDTGQVVARFEAERQALAIMDHPNIARVLDAGATDTGRPFFVMELVKGVPITEYCDRNHLTPKERLELFIPVCQAIQHAHQKGIIHRDIKPSNVLIALHDGRPVPKVIDFGVAKAVDQRLTERTLFTEFGQIVGTLEYMSPEQAEMGALDIDTRSDVYSLGVMLYELLTGSTPLERVKLRSAAYAEILKRIREEEPPKPSTRLSESKDSLPSISAQRKMEPARLTRLIRGELDWIVMKSLDKDRTRRYETANGFARDIQRFLDGEPVEACPPSATYRLRKFARKHRVVLATAGAFALLLVAATAISAGLALWANRERIRAQDREGMAIDAVRRYADVVRETPELKNNSELAKLRATLLKEPLLFFRILRDRLQVARATTPESLHRLAEASFDLGELTAEIGDKQNALRAYEESLAIRERLARENPSVIHYQSDLAASLNNIANLMSSTGRMADALASFEQALVIRKRLARENPSDTQLWSSLATSHSAFGHLMLSTSRPTEALSSFEQARAICERLARENPSDAQFQTALAKRHGSIGDLMLSTGRSVDALASFERARAIYERLARENSSDTQFRSDLAACLHRIGSAQKATGRSSEALASYQQARAIGEQLVRENRSDTLFRHNLAAVLYNAANLQIESGRPAEALELHEQARAIGEQLVRENPSDLGLQSLLSSIYDNIGVRQRTTGRFAEALVSFEHARAMRESLEREHPESPTFARELGATWHNMAMIDLDLRHFDKALSKLSQAIEWQRKALAANPKDSTCRKFLGNHLAMVIAAAKGLGRTALADKAQHELVALAAHDPAKAALDARLTVVLQGKEPPAGDAERIQLAYRAYEKKMHASSARLFAAAFVSAPKLADDLQSWNRYNAACNATLAGCGHGDDDQPPDDSAKAKLRRQALEWLGTDLAAWGRVLETGKTEDRESVSNMMIRWKGDSDLVGIRDEKELAKLPIEERPAFKQLWKDVDQLLTKARDRK